MDPFAPTIEFTDFIKSDLRAGSIVAIEPVPKSKKLLKLEVSFGELGSRTILATVADCYPDRIVVGQKVMAVVNIPPRAMMGFESHGMLLAAHDAEGKTHLVNPGPVPDGQVIG